MSGAEESAGPGNREVPTQRTTDSADPESDFLPISALQHFAYCQRQFALIHVEQSWAENRFTAEGQVLHERVNSGTSESRGSLHIARSVRLCSHRLRLTGIADVVEFHRVDADGVVLAGRSGRWSAIPVEYKRGRAKSDDWDRYQLCAQALCLEEMLEHSVNEGAIFYGQPRRREQIALNADLRRRTEDLAIRMHRMWEMRRTPSPEFGPKCNQCSLATLCMPNVGRSEDSASAYLERVLGP